MDKNLQIQQIHTQMQTRENGEDFWLNREHTLNLVFCLTKSAAKRAAKKTMQDRLAFNIVAQNNSLPG